MTAPVVAIFLIGDVEIDVGGMPYRSLNSEGGLDTSGVYLRLHGPIVANPGRRSRTDWIIPPVPNPLAVYEIPRPVGIVVVTAAGCATRATNIFSDDRDVIIHPPARIEQPKWTEDENLAAAVANLEDRCCTPDEPWVNPDNPDHGHTDCWAIGTVLRRLRHLEALHVADEGYGNA